MEPAKALFVKNVPALPHTVIQELFTHYGAKKSIPLASGVVWILEFEDLEQTSAALHSLNNTNVSYLELSNNFLNSQSY